MIEAQNASRILAGVAAVSTSARKYANVGLDLAYEPPPVLVRVNLRITVSLASWFDCTAISMVGWAFDYGLRKKP